MRAKDSEIAELREQLQDALEQNVQGSGYRDRGCQRRALPLQQTSCPRNRRCSACLFVQAEHMYINKSLAFSGLSGSRSKFVGLRLVAIGFAWALGFFMICMGSLLFFCGLTFFAARGELCVCLSKVSRRPGLSSGLEDGVCSNCRRSPAPHFRGCPRRHSRSRSPHRRGSRT